MTPKQTDTPKKQTEQAQKQRRSSRPPRIADAIAALINSEKSRGATTGAGGDPTLGKTTGKSATLTQSQLDGLVAQIKTCMNVPAGLRRSGELRRSCISTSTRSGNVIGMPDDRSVTGRRLDRALASAAQRAVLRCVPYPMLPPANTLAMAVGPASTSLSTW